MIVVQDCIETKGTDLARLRAVFEARYRPAAAARGLRFLGEQVSPPLRLAEGSNTLWLRWEVADAAAWWQMRYQAGDPAVAEFWRELDSFVLKRERRYLVNAAAALPQPEDTSAYLRTPARWRETAQLTLREDVDAAARAMLEQALREAAAGLPGVIDARLEANFVADYGAGHYTWDLLYADRASAEAARAEAAWRDGVLPLLDAGCRARCALGLETLAAGAREPSLSGGVKRTALFRLLPGVDEVARRAFEADTAEMAAHIPAIRNWRLSRAVALDWDASDVAPWSYVWEQEYAALEGLTVDYMVHPHHWAHIDRYFDPESGAQIIDTALCHAFCALRQAFVTA